MEWRDRARDADRDAVLALVRSTGFFSPEEEAIAVELVDEALKLGAAASGYEFVFADSADGRLLGYACFGPIPGRPGAFDLYWIAVAPWRQGGGLGRQLIAEAERRAATRGAVRMFIDTAGRDQYRPTRAFYERMGYAHHETVADFYAPGDDKIVYHKRLRQP
jgi:ribosomal protein S18 acetylase RimI-like enzyme